MRFPGRRRSRGRRVLTVEGPPSRILGDVLADAVQRIDIPDDVFVVIALPDRMTGHAPQGIDFTGGNGFEILYHGRQ